MSDSATVDLFGENIPASPGKPSPSKHISPFRYAGGKSWFVPEIRAWLAGVERVGTFVEPFAGGAVVGLTVAIEDLADRVVLCEKDPEVAAVWSVIFSGSDAEVQALCDRISGFVLTRESAIASLACKPYSEGERAFQTILKNRVNRGGILAAGASLLKAGENNKGITSRWYPETLVKRIAALRPLKEKIEFVTGDAFDLIARYKDDASAAFFIDPPYTAGGKNAGSRLYNHSVIDHRKLFRECAAASFTFLMTYDDSEDVIALAGKNGLAIRKVPMKSTHHVVKEEIVVYRG